MHAQETVRLSKSPKVIVADAAATLSETLDVSLVASGWAGSNVQSSPVMSHR